MCAKSLKHIEEAWKCKTNASNRLFNAGKFKESLVGYEQALSRAEVLNNYMDVAMNIGIPFIQTFVISCNNLAFTYEKLEHFDKGATLLKRAIYFLLIKSKDPRLNVDEIQNELQRALLNYLDYSHRNVLGLSDVDKVFIDIQEQLALNKAL